ncbi:MAG: glycosyltransferase family 2 protein [Verrucomicrobia bacterium]|nr:glycosyltransferase family 2 protein [Verrucomicrobiota bacterium]
MTTDPLVSILVPTYNREGYIGECLQSALNQSYQNFEVIVVDNASTDSTCDIVERIALQDQRVRLFRNDCNVGPVRNWGRCLAEARGALAKFLWSDDLISPTFLSKTVPWLTDNPEVGFVYTGFEMFCEGNTHRERSWRVGETGVYASLAYRQGVLADCRFPPSPGCALFRLKDLRCNLAVFIPNHHNLDLSMSGVGADMLFYLKTTGIYPNFAFIDEPLSFFRYHPDSLSAASRGGSVPLSYALAKTSFFENSATPKCEIKRHNAYLFLLLKLFGNNALGFRRIENFYFNTNPNTAIDWFYMMKIGTRFLCHEFDRRFKRIITSINDE